jgi:hypothetical protein
MTLAQEIVASSVFSITEILVIENDKLYGTFLHVAFGSQSLLKPTRTGAGDQRGVNESQLKFIEVTRPISQNLPDMSLF